MTFDEMIETFIDEGVRAYKHNYRNSLMFRKLNRHETFHYQGVDFNYWQELAVYKTGQWIREILPDVSVEVNLEGNNSNIKLDITDEDLQKLTTKLYVVLKTSGVRL